MALTGLAFAAVALARMEHRTAAARAALVAVPAVLIATFALWVANAGFDDYLAAAPVAAPTSAAAFEDPAARGPFAVRTLTYGSGTSLHASLGDEPAYRAPFQTPSSGRASLPDGIVVAQLRGAGAVVLEDFEDGGAVTDDEPSSARIEALLSRDGERDQGNRALRLAWTAGERATFEVAVAPEDAARWPAASALTYALAAVSGATPPSALAIELEATDGRIARRTLGGTGSLVAPLPAHLVRARRLHGLNGFAGPIRPEEVVLQTFTVPMSAFEGAGLEPAELAVVRFVFGGEGAGAVYLDEVLLTGE